jgi:hypothetical protein
LAWSLLAGPSYPVLRRLPGRDSHPRGRHSFHDAPWSNPNLLIHEWRGLSRSASPDRDLSMTLAGEPVAPWRGERGWSQNSPTVDATGWASAATQTSP